MAIPKRLWRLLGSVEGFTEGLSIFGDTDDDLAYFVNGKQVANERMGELELRLTKAVIRARREELRQDPRVELRGTSDWVTLHVRSPRDDQFVRELARLSAEAHAPAPGAMATPPPTGADLARRRRFH